MPLTPEEKLNILKEQGIDPRRARVVETDDEVQIHMLPTEDRNVLSTGLRHFGASIPRTAVGLGAGRLATSALIPATLTGPAGFLATLGAGVGGGMLGTAAYDAIGLDKSAHDLVGLSEAQRARDEQEHPWIVRGAEFGSQIPLLKFADPKVLGSAASKLARLERIGTGNFGLTAEEAKAALNAAGNVGVNLGFEGLRQIKNKKFEPGELALSALAGLPFGDFRGTKTAPAVASAQPQANPAPPSTAMASEASRAAAAAQPKAWAPKPAKVGPENFTPEGRETVLPDPYGPPQPMAEVPVPRLGQLPVEPENALPRLRLADPTTERQLRNLGPNLSVRPAKKPSYISIETPGEPLGDTPNFTWPGRPMPTEAAEPGGRNWVRSQPPTWQGANSPINTGPSLRTLPQLPGPKPMALLPERTQGDYPWSNPENIGAGGKAYADELTFRAGELKRAGYTDEAIADMLRTEALQSAAEQSGLKKYQPSPKADAADAPTPEPLETVQAQVRAAADPRSTKKAAFIVAGSDVPPDTGGLVAVPHRKGTLLYNPAKMTRAEADAAVAGDQIDGRVLGMSQPVKPPEGAAVVATDLPGAPAVQTEVVAGPEQVPAAVEAARSAVPGGTQRLATPEEIEAGRQALRKRGFAFEETDQPIVMPDGGEAAGQFDPVTGAIKVSASQARPTTHVHEGLHAQLQNMMLSENPREVRLAAELLKAVNEEPLVELGAEAQYKQRGENPLTRLIKANWDYFRASRLGGGDTSPERMAARLADYFSTEAPGPARGLPEGGRGPVAQPIARPEDQEHVPWSVVEQISRQSKATGAAVAANAQEKAILRGRHIAAAEEQLGKFPRAVVNSAVQKRQQEFLFGQRQQWTPEEMAVDAIYDKAMKSTAAESSAAGYPIKVLDRYVPEPLSTQAARDYQADGPAFLQKHLPEFLDWNQRIYGASFDPADASAYLQNYMARAALSPNSMGSDFGALTKSAREYHLPPSLQEPDALRAFGRYGTRWASQVAYKKTIEPVAEAMQVLGYSKVLGPNGEEVHDPRAGSEEAQNARWAVDDVLFNQGAGTSGVKQSVRDVARATQQLANTAGIGTLSQVRNTVQKMPYHAMHAAQMPGGFENLVTQSLKVPGEFQAARQRAIENGFIRPGIDPAAILESDGMLTRAAQTEVLAANKLRKYTAAQALENFNRVHDFMVGEGLAEIALKGAAAGDPQSQKFLNRFGAGVDTTMPHEEQVARLARNYGEGAQGSYGPQGLPANLLKGGLTGTVFRIQRYGLENMMRVHQYAVKPALKGDYKPLLVYVLGQALAFPVLKKLSEMFSGRPSGLPTEEEIAAGKKDPGMERLLNLMAAAQVTGAFGTAGSVLGTAANNARGSQQGLVGDPAMSFGVDVVHNLAGAADAMKEGEPAAEVIVEAVKRAMVDNVQVLRRLRVDEGEATDRRNKRVFEYLTERRQVTLPEMANNMMGGGLFGQAPEINPTMDAARQGDQEALARLPRKDRMRADNYPGGYEDPAAEGQYQKWLGEAKGPETLEEYRARRKSYKERVRGR